MGGWRTAGDRRKSGAAAVAQPDTTQHRLDTETRLGWALPRTRERRNGSDYRTGQYEFAGKGAVAAALGDTRLCGRVRFGIRRRRRDSRTSRAIFGHLRTLHRIDRRSG